MYRDNFALHFLYILFTESACYTSTTHMIAVQIGYIASEDVVAYHLMKAPHILCDSDVNTLRTGDANLHLLRFCITTVKDR
jgi:hypothetical protein